MVFLTSAVCCFWAPAVSISDLVAVFDSFSHRWVWLGVAALLLFCSASCAPIFVVQVLVFCFCYLTGSVGCFFRFFRDAGRGF